MCHGKFWELQELVIKVQMEKWTSADILPNHSIWNKDFNLESLNTSQFISLDKLFLHIQTTKHTGLFLHKGNQVGRANKYKAFIQRGENTTTLIW